MVMWETAFPARDHLISVRGVVRSVKLGGEGHATYFDIEDGNGVKRYASYYGKVWPGMENLASGDVVELSAERKKIRRFGEKKQYWIWELWEDSNNIVNYWEMLAFRQQGARKENFVANMTLATAALLLLAASSRKLMHRSGKVEGL